MAFVLLKPRLPMSALSAQREFVCLLTALVTPAWAQETQIERARQFALPGVAPVTPTALTEQAEHDPDSFGVQQVLREKEQLRPFSAFAEISAFVTNNVALTHHAHVADSFLIATFGFEYRRPLPSGFEWEAALKVATFRYDEFTRLNFNSVDAGVGVSYHASRLGGLDFFARYNFTALMGAETWDTFFQNHTITLGAQKTVPFSRAQSIFFGASGQLGFADPKEAERSELAAYAGYHLEATRRLDVDLLYRYDYYIYSRGGRRDQNHTVSIGLRYRLTDWCSVSASSFFVVDRSNQEVFSYDAGNAGGALTLSLQF